MKDLMIAYSSECDIHVGKLLDIGTELFIGNYDSIVLMPYYYLTWPTYLTYLLGLCVLFVLLCSWTRQVRTI